MSASVSQGELAGDERPQGQPHVPRVVVFACNWCSYAAADLAGTTRLQLPTSFTLVRVMCSGRVDTLLVLQAFALGADAVLVTGCHPGDCHYTSGNIHARQRIDFLSHVLQHLGLSERLEMRYISAAEARRFQQVLTDFCARIADLGPSPLRPAPAEHTADKRAGLRALLGHLVATLDIALPDSAPVPEELVPEGYGEPRWDPERCIGCGACAASCPQDNIVVTDAGTTRAIARFQSRCVRCATCEEICPADALKVAPRFDLAAFLSDRCEPALELELRVCARCGQPFAPVRQIADAATRARQGGLTADETTLCAACRRQAHAAQMRHHMAHLAVGDRR